MSTQRFIVENIGSNIETFKTALAGAIQFSQQNGLNKITLVVGMKQMAPNTVVGQFLGEKLTKSLCAGNSEPLPNGISLNLTIPKQIREFDPHEVVIAVHLPDADMRVVDGIRTASAIVNLPFDRTEGEGWMSTWEPTVWGVSSWSVAPTSLPSPVEKALQQLSDGINFSTGLAHPRDRERATEVLKNIANLRTGVTEIDVGRWAMAHGWSARHADDLVKLAAKCLK